MSTDDEKLKHGRRLQQDQNAIKKQAKIARSHGFNDKDQVLKEPNRLNKHHAMDCGNPDCYLCGNPRRTHKDKLTAQEHRLFQDLDNVRDKKSNGVKVEEEND